MSGILSGVDLNISRQLPDPYKNLKSNFSNGALLLGQMQARRDKNAAIAKQQAIQAARDKLASDHWDITNQRAVDALNAKEKEKTDINTALANANANKSNYATMFNNDIATAQGANPDAFDKSYFGKNYDAYKKLYYNPDGTQRDSSTFSDKEKALAATILPSKAGRDINTRIAEAPNVYTKNEYYNSLMSELANKNIDPVKAAALAQSQSTFLNPDLTDKQQAARDKEIKSNAKEQYEVIKTNLKNEMQVADKRLAALQKNIGKNSTSYKNNAKGRDSLMIQLNKDFPYTDWWGGLGGKDLRKFASDNIGTGKDKYTVNEFKTAVYTVAEGQNDTWWHKDREVPKDELLSVLNKLKKDRLDGKTTSASASDYIDAYTKQRDILSKKLTDAGQTYMNVRNAPAPTRMSNQDRSNLALQQFFKNGMTEYNAGNTKPAVTSKTSGKTSGKSSGTGKTGGDKTMGGKTGKSNVDSKINNTSNTLASPKAKSEKELSLLENKLEKALSRPPSSSKNAMVARLKSQVAIKNAEVNKFQRKAIAKDTQDARKRSVNKVDAAFNDLKSLSTDLGKQGVYSDTLNKYHNILTPDEFALLQQKLHPIDTSAKDALNKQRGAAIRNYVNHNYGEPTVIDKYFKELFK